MVAPNGSNRIDTLLRDGYTTNLGQYFSGGWELFKQNAGGFIGFTLVCILIALLPTLFPEAVQQSLSRLISLISGPLFAGFYIVGLKLLKHRPTRFGDFFKGFQKLDYFLANLVGGFLIGLGFLLLIVPGIYLLVGYSFTMPLIADRNLGFWEAMETSRKVISKRWFAFLGLTLLLVVLNLAGILLFGLGLLVTIPLTYCVITAAYTQVVGLATVDF